MICQPFTVDCFNKEPESSNDDETSDPLDSFRKPCHKSLIMNNTVFDTNCEELAFPSLSDCNRTRTHNHLVCK